MEIPPVSNVIPCHHAKHRRFWSARGIVSNRDQTRRIDTATAHCQEEPKTETLQLSVVQDLSSKLTFPSNLDKPVGKRRRRESVSGLVVEITRHVAEFAIVCRVHCSAAVAGTTVATTPRSPARKVSSRTSVSRHRNGKVSPSARTETSRRIKRASAQNAQEHSLLPPGMPLLKPPDEAVNGKNPRRSRQQPPPSHGDHRRYSVRNVSYTFREPFDETGDRSLWWLKTRYVRRGFPSKLGDKV